MRTQALLAPLNHEETALRVKAERAMNTRTEGDVRYLLVAMPKSSTVRFGYVRWSARQTVHRWYAENVAAPHRMPNRWASLAEELLENGARAILAEVYNGEAPA